MPFQIIIHLIIAFMWMLLNESYTGSSFIAGYLIGAVLLFLMRRFLPGSFYLRRLFMVLGLIILFIKELILSNIDIVKLVYKPRLKGKVEPGIFAYPTELKKEWEIALLANLITLTPGTLSVALSDDHSIIYIHAMHIDTEEEAIQSIKNTFEKAILEVTR
ncbi:Na+/H+ antiporter subunit E [Aciduricibacillus chroicocephali]|uniref:Na+/H+ antiporter subunit E n=1 Tax=Aciduricibacillus chroicocephali TaxID=3054939 RepID=A0ABY9KSF3_9BACI|nr:Na+/H+ antiporter subunit E [Bacillaceae bacterium 44XB]